VHTLLSSPFTLLTMFRPMQDLNKTGKKMEEDNKKGTVLFAAYTHIIINQKVCKTYVKKL